MQLEKELNQKDESINLYEELFSKKTLEVEQTPENSSPENLTKEEVIKPEITESFLFEKKKSFFEKFNFTSTNVNMKHIVIGLLIGIITNISIYHYQTIALQGNSQKLATGLIYNLSDSNDLQQIATNIYLGMKENGWEPTVKLSNANSFVFELDKGGEFTITKNVDLISTKFHVSVSNFSNEMIAALKVQLEPNKIGGTKNFITNKEYDSKTKSISFDIEKIGAGSMDMNMPLYIPNLSNVVNNLPPVSNANTNENVIGKKLIIGNDGARTVVYPNEISNNKDSKIITIPISPELNGKLKQDKNINIDPNIQVNKEVNKEINQLKKF